MRMHSQRQPRRATLLYMIDDLYFASRISVGTPTPTQGDPTLARRGRTIAAFFIAPLTPAIALTPILMVGNGVLFGLALGFYALVVNAVVAYPISLVVGVPLHLLARRRGWSGLILYLGAGVAFGTFALLIWAACQLVGDSFADPLDCIPAIAAGAFASGLVTSCFWLIARPDRT